LNSHAWLLGEYESGRRDFTGLTFEGLRAARCELKGCNFTGCSFVDCVFGGVKFDGSLFVNSSFSDCNCIDASFVDCTFDGAEIGPSAFQGADFFGASFDRSVIHGTNFKGAFFVTSHWTTARTVGANFNDAIFGANTVARCHFVHCSFEAVRVVQPVDIDYETASSSIGMSLRPLLDKTGISGDTRRHIRRYLRSLQLFLTMLGIPRDAIRSYSGSENFLADHANVFISYSAKDEEFASALHNHLTVAGIETWFAPHSIQGGKRIIDQVSSAIERQKKLILILSENSISSDWVASEIRRAVEIEHRTKAQKLFPIRIVDFEPIRTWTLFDSDAGFDLARKVREYHIPDFTDWRDDLAFGVSVTRLVNDLRSD
jgi:hypothetical protein